MGRRVLCGWRLCLWTRKKNNLPLLQKSPFSSAVLDTTYLVLYFFFFFLSFRERPYQTGPSIRLAVALDYLDPFPTRVRTSPSFVWFLCNKVSTHHPACWSHDHRVAVSHENKRRRAATWRRDASPKRRQPRTWRAPSQPHAEGKRSYSRCGAWYWPPPRNPTDRIIIFSFPERKERVDYTNAVGRTWLSSGEWASLPSPPTPVSRPGHARTVATQLSLAVCRTESFVPRMLSNDIILVWSLSDEERSIERSDHSPVLVLSHLCVCLASPPLARMERLLNLLSRNENGQRESWGVRRDTDSNVLPRWFVILKQSIFRSIPPSVARLERAAIKESVDHSERPFSPVKILYGNLSVCKTLRETSHLPFHIKLLDTNALLATNKWKLIFPTTLSRGHIK